MNTSNPKQSSADRYFYFQPNEVVYFISHEGKQLNPEETDLVVDSLVKWSNDQKGDLEIDISRYRDPILNLPGSKEERYTSIISLEARNPLEDGDVDPSQLAELIIRLDRSRNDYSIERKATDESGQPMGYTIQAVSPNWLSSPCSEFGTGGGPGARPAPFTGATPPDASLYKLHFPNEFEQLCSPNEEERGEDIVVAVLDTARDPERLKEAYDNWDQSAVNQGNRHLLIETLLRPNGPLQVHLASSEERQRMRRVYLKDHFYDMTDHGLFVSGIVHSIAPAAEIHLYEVLNQWGVGDLTTLATTLSEVIESFAGRKLIVNCSLVLNIPVVEPERIFQKFKGELSIKGHRHTDLDENLVRYLIDADNGLTYIQRVVAAVEEACNLLVKNSSKVIAAAGNDWEKQQDRPITRYPAAFESVLGIGALPKIRTKTENVRRKPSTYSNLSDAPGWVGVATLGGEPGAHNGLLGVYLGEFPSEQSGTPANPPAVENKFDWAWWAGTSFATPIVTGAIAAVLSGPSQPATVEEALDLMYENGVIVNEKTEYDEDVLDVDVKV